MSHMACHQMVTLSMHGMCQPIMQKQGQATHCHHTIARKSSQSYVDGICLNLSKDNVAQLSCISSSDEHSNCGRQTMLGMAAGHAMQQNVQPALFGCRRLQPLLPVVLTLQKRTANLELNGDAPMATLL